MEKPPKTSEYNKKGIPDDHVQLVNDRLNYFNVEESSKCNMFIINLVGQTKLWFNAFPDRSIES